MEFHRGALELLGDPDLPPDPARGLAAVHLASAAGVRLPPAVAEWYTVPEASPAWLAFSRYDGSILRCGGDPAGWWFGRPPGRGETPRARWADPPVCRDRRGWILDPILPLMGESCGGWWWGVALTGAADPPAVITFDEGDTWDVCGSSFSAYVHSILFDAGYDGPGGCRAEVRLEGRHLCGHERSELLEAFRAAPPSRVAYFPYYTAELTERYARTNQRVAVCNLQTPTGFRARHDSLWRVWAGDGASFDDLVGRLSRVFPAFTGLVPTRDGGRSIPPGSTAAGHAGHEPPESDIPF